MDNWIMAIYGHTYYQCIYIYIQYISMDWDLFHGFMSHEISTHDPKKT